ncbi:SMN family protein Smn1 [Metarhizium guizhouense ARSEF 977]|uniref:SMN family protein Smn1 n=1 Tax=Metarhizium guizhouense (strain ARSEF 977) TaxID=1276136 RepID=A0A0B4I9Y1_METGA|nr:SMN family protein Smn1 [Metarhizium guizhouense ARSEF 977]
MGIEQVELSHEEVWDDTALIDSWNEALAEYKKYHSVHAKGGSIRDLESKISQRAPESEPNKQSNKSEPVSSTGNEDPDATFLVSSNAADIKKDLKFRASPVVTKRCNGSCFGCAAAASSPWLK